jgi:hypothetical protein
MVCLMVFREYICVTQYIDFLIDIDIDRRIWCTCLCKLFLFYSLFSSTQRMKEKRKNTCTYEVLQEIM